MSDPIRTTRSGRAFARSGMAAIMLACLVLAGCAGQSNEAGAGADFDQVNMAPGDTRTCYSNPCGVMFSMPQGSGRYTVRANNQLVGTYPAGQVANLGNFFKIDSPVSITVDGIEAKPAVLFIVGRF